MAAGDHRPRARIAIVGTGYVADLYMASLRGFPGLEVVGAFDVAPGRLAAFARHWSVAAAPDLAGLFAAKPDILLNLTNPAAHADVTRAALEAGLHVWSEKPLALDLDEAEALVALAGARGLPLASAP